MRYTLSLLVLFILFSCKDKTDDLKGKIEYDGPVLESDDISVVHSDSGFVQVKMSTAKQLKYSNGDEVFPRTVYVTFIDKNGVEYSKLRGDSARYNSVANLYVIKGNVLINNTRENQSLATEELFWEPNSDKIYSDKKVEIKTPRQQFTAMGGMEATQDFSHYTLRKSSGTVVVDSIRTVPVMAEPDSVQQE